MRKTDHYGGILVHSSLQSCLSSLRFVGIHFSTALLKSYSQYSAEVWALHRYSTGFSSFSAICCRFAGMLGYIVAS